MAELRKQLSGAYSGDASSWRASPTPMRAPLASSRSKRKWPRCTPRVSSRRTYTAQCRGSSDDLAAKAPGLDWPALLDAAGLKDARTFIVWHPKAIPGLSALAAKEPLDDMERLARRFTLSNGPATSFRRRSSTSASAFTARRSAVFPSCARDGSGVWISPARRSEKRSAGCTSSAISRRRRKRRRRRW